MASEAQDFISNSDVQDSFVASIADTAGVPESMVEVTLWMESSSGRRLSADCTWESGGVSWFNSLLAEDQDASYEYSMGTWSDDDEAVEGSDVTCAQANFIEEYYQDFGVDVGDSESFATFLEYYNYGDCPSPPEECWDSPAPPPTSSPDATPAPPTAAPPTAAPPTAAPPGSPTVAPASTPTPPTPSSQVEVMVTYVITVQEGTSNSEFDSMVATMESTSAEEFMANFDAEFKTTASALSFSGVEAVPGSATFQASEEASSATSQQDVTSQQSEESEAGRQQSAFLFVLLLPSFLLPSFLFVA
jgi:hypothetical protein